MASADETVISSTVALDIFIVEVVVFAVAVISYIARILVKRRQSKGVGLDDVLATFAVLFLAAIEALLWRYKFTHNNIVDDDDLPGQETLSRSGAYMVIYWSVTAASQLSILWYYRYVCSGFSWAKKLLHFSSIITISGWLAFTVCDSLNLAFVRANSTRGMNILLAGYGSFETASMILEPLCFFLIFCIQLFRLNHIRDKVIEKPWLILASCSSVIAVVSGALRLFYFLQQDVVSERTWLQVHLGAAILACSVPVYTGLENACCQNQNPPLPSIEVWLRNIQTTPAPTVPTTPVAKEFRFFEDPEAESMPSASMPASRRPSQSSAWAGSSSRRPSIASTQHGQTRDIAIDHDEGFPISPQFVPSRQSSRAGRATKRLILEG